MCAYSERCVLCYVCTVNKIARVCMVVYYKFSLIKISLIVYIMQPGFHPERIIWGGGGGGGGGGGEASDETLATTTS